MTDLFRDIRYAVRSLLRAPGFTLAAAVTLALGVGATAGMFTLLEQVALSKLPVAEPDRLALLQWEGSWNGSNNGFSAWSYPWYRDLRDRNEVFSDLLCRDLMSVSLGYDADARRINAELISGNYFATLGLAAAAGRLISEEDDRTPGGHPVAVLTHDFWRTRFESRQDAVGKEIRIGGRAFTVIGVAPRGFHGIVLGETPQVFVPVAMKESLAAGWETTYGLENRRGRWLQVLGRLKPGVSLQQAQAGLEPLHAALVEYDLQQPEAAEWSEYSREQYRKARVEVLPGAQGVSPTRNQARVPLWTLTGMVGLLLLIGCGNIASLMMARAEGRRKEIAVRLALGAGRGRIARRLMTESLLLAAVGLAPALLVASGTAELLVRLIADPDTTTVLSTDPDLRMLAVSAALAALTAVLFGLTPALQSVRVKVATTLKDQSGAVAGGNVGIRKALVVGQVFLSLVLLVGAGLMWRTLTSLGDVDTGYETDHVVVFGIDPPRAGLEIPQSQALLQELRGRIAALPGVEDAGYALVRVMAGERWDSSVDVIGYDSEPGENVQVWFNAISPGYLSTIGLDILAGRDFRASDSWEASVMIVNQEFVDYFFDGGNAIGRLVEANDNRFEIVGVIPNTRYDNLRSDVPRQMYVPYRDCPFTLESHMYARTTGDPEALMSTIRAVTAEAAQNLPVYNMRTMDAQVASTLTTERMLATLGGAFGGLAAFLSGVGLYGVLAFAMARRTKEIGLRIALGAQGGDITWLAMRQAIGLFVLGAGLAIPTSLLLARLIESQIYGVSPYDLQTLAAAVALLAAVATVAALLPAVRAARTQPMSALRFE